MAAEIITLKCSDNGKIVLIEGFYLMAYSKTFREMLSSELTHGQHVAIPVAETAAVWTLLAEAMRGKPEALSYYKDPAVIIGAIDKYDMEPLKALGWASVKSHMDLMSPGEEKGVLAVNMAKLAAKMRDDKMFRRCAANFWSGRRVPYDYEKSVPNVHYLDIWSMTEQEMEQLGVRYVRALARGIRDGPNPTSDVQDWSRVASAIAFEPQVGATTR